MSRLRLAARLWPFACTPTIPGQFHSCVQALQKGPRQCQTGHGISIGSILSDGTNRLRDFGTDLARPARAPPFPKLPALLDCTSPQAVVKTVATLCNASKEWRADDFSEQLGKGQHRPRKMQPCGKVLDSDDEPALTPEAHVSDGPSSACRMCPLVSLWETGRSAERPCRLRSCQQHVAARPLKRAEHRQSSAVAQLRLGDAIDRGSAGRRENDDTSRWCGLNISDELRVSRVLSVPGRLCVVVNAKQPRAVLERCLLRCSVVSHRQSCSADIGCGDRHWKTVTTTPAAIRSCNGGETCGWVAWCPKSCSEACRESVRGESLQEIDKDLC